MPGPNDPYAIPVPEDQTTPAAPWLPAWWSYAGQATPEPEQATPTQPGLGIPAPLVDQAMPDQFEMPEEYMGKVSMSEPRVPIEAEPMFQGQAPIEPGAFPDAVSDPGPVIPSYAEPSVRELASEQLRNPADPADEIVPYGVQLTEEQRARQFAASSPEEQYRQEKAYLDQRDAVELAKRRDAIALEDQQRQLEAQSALLKARERSRQAMVDLDAESKKLAETDVDPERWWSSRSTPQKIAGFLAAIVGGLVQARSGGPNSGLAMIERAIDQDIDAQKANLANKRAALQARGASIQQMAALDAEDYELGEKFRIASYSRLMNQIQGDMVNYDPAGKNAIELGKVYQAIGQQRQKALVDFEDRNFKQQVDAYKADADLRKTEAEIAKMQAETAKIRGGGGGGGAGAAKQPPEYFASRGLEAPPVPMSDKEYKSWLSAKKGSQEIAKNEQEIQANSRAGLSKEQRELGIPGVKMKDGTELIARGGTEEAKALRKKVSATKSLVQLMDEAIRIRNAAGGWTSDVLKSDEWRALQSNWATAIGVAKDVFGLGALAGPDMELVTKALSTSDPTEFRDPTKGIEAARRNFITLTANELTGAGLDTQWDIPKPKISKPQDDATDTTQKRALSSDVGSFESFQADLDSLPQEQRPQGSEDRFGYYSSRAVGPDAAKKYVPAGIQRHIDDLAAKARTGDEKAHAMLGELAQKGGSPAIKSAAQIALQATNMPSDSLDLGSVREVARDSVAEPPKKGKK